MDRKKRKETDIYMNKLPIKKVVEGLLKLQDTGESATLLGIGPMSPNLLQASFEIAKDYDFPLMFIASRNQVDADALGGGYVNGWDQKRFREDIRRVAEQVGFDGLYYLCRDHGGPWQRDNERNAHLSEEEAMKLAYPIMAFVIALLLEKLPQNRFYSLAIAFSVALVICYAAGCLMFIAVAHADLAKALSLTVIPFVPLDLAKIVFAAAATLALKKALYHAKLLPLT